MSDILSKTQADTGVVQLTKFLVRVQVENFQGLDARLVDYMTDDLDERPHQLIVLGDFSKP